MILIGPGFALLLFLMVFKPVRFVVGWFLFLALCLVAAFMVFAVVQNGGRS